MASMRLLIVDDHPIIEESLLFFLEQYPDITVVGTARDGREGLTQLRKTRPDMILLDLAMPKLDGVEAIRLYLQERPEVGIVVFTGQKSSVYLHQALQAGARGYVLKGNPVAQIVEALRAVRQGGSWLSPELSDAVIGALTREPDQGPDEITAFKSLTAREEQVFRLLAAGKTTQEIADLLHISPKTVAKHRVAVKEKLRLKNPAEMATFAVKIGLNSLEET